MSYFSVAAVRAISRNILSQSHALPAFAFTRRGLWQFPLLTRPLLQRLSQPLRQPVRKLCHAVRRAQTIRGHRRVSFRHHLLIEHAFVRHMRRISRSDSELMDVGEMDSCMDIWVDRDGNLRPDEGEGDRMLTLPSSTLTEPRISSGSPTRPRAGIFRASGYVS